MLEELKRWLKPARQDKTIFDIVIYGSAVKGKRIPGDIDIAVVFREGTLKERLDKIQGIKKNIPFPKIDLKGILWEELFQESFFARAGIFLDGISLFDSKPFSRKIGFHGFALFTYSLKDKSHAQKVKFNYVLSGRTGAGMIKVLEGTHLAPGVVQIPIKHAMEFEEVLNKHHVVYKRENILVERY